MPKNKGWWAQRDRQKAFNSRAQTRGQSGDVETPYRKDRDSAAAAKRRARLRRATRAMARRDLCTGALSDFERFY